MGERHSWQGESHTVIDAHIEGNEGSPVHVMFKSSEALLEGLTVRYPQKSLVGWYHSHPGLGCFLSPTDQEAHRTGFGDPHSLALVVDPLRRSFSLFAYQNNRFIHPSYVFFDSSSRNEHG